MDENNITPYTDEIFAICQQQYDAKLLIHEGMDRIAICLDGIKASINNSAEQRIRLIESFKDNYIRMYQAEQNEAYMEVIRACNVLIDIERGDYHG